MKKETWYECPVCKKTWETNAEAIACRDKHPPKKHQMYVCGVCGAGWFINHWGEVGAAREAAKCENKHQDKGEVEELSLRTFFLSKGQHGKYYPPGGKERGI